MNVYMDQDGRIRCADCNLLRHRGRSCDEAIKRNFERNMARIRVQDGSERYIEDYSNKGRI